MEKGRERRDGWVEEKSDKVGWLDRRKTDEAARELEDWTKGLDETEVGEKIREGLIDMTQYLGD